MKFFDKFKIFDKKPVSPDDQESDTVIPVEELEADANIGSQEKAFSSGITQEDIDKALGTQTLPEQVDVSSQEIAEFVGENTPEPSELPNMDTEAEPSFGEKFNQKMKDVYEKAKEISMKDVKTFFTKERESQVVETGGKIAYDTLGTITGTKAITDWALYGLHKLGLKSSIKGDVHKYFAENDMERALVGITNRAIELRKAKAEKGNLSETDYNLSSRSSKDNLKKAALDYRDKIYNLNVSQEKKDDLMKEFRLIMRDHKEQELTIAKGESEKFDQAMRRYTGNKVSGLKLGKDALNSALSLSGFYALRGASYLGFSALEKGKESWDKKSRELYETKREEIKITKKTEDMPDWQSNYRELSSEKMKAVFKGVTIDSAKETYNELVHGRKEGKSAEAKERKESFKVEKSANIEMLKQHLEEEGVGLFGRTWRVNWERVKNLNPETIKENLMRLQALGKIARVAGVSLIGIQTYESDGSMFKGAYDKLLDSMEKGEMDKAIAGNMYGNVSRLLDAPGVAKDRIFNSETWKDFKYYAGKAAVKVYDVMGPNELGAATLEENVLSDNVKVVQPYSLHTDKKFKEAINKYDPRFSGAKKISNETSPLVAKPKNDFLDSSTKIVHSSRSQTDEKFNEMINKYDPRFSGTKVEASGASRVPVSGEKNIEAQKVTVENRSQPKHFQIAEKVTIKKGDSIWTVGEKHLEGNPDFHKLKGFLRIYNIDRVKDTIVAHPEKYGLKPGFNPEKMSAKQIQEIKWQQAFDDTFQKNGITTHLPKGHRGGGDHHHPEAKPRLGKLSGRMFTEGENIPGKGVELPKAPIVPETHVEVPPTDTANIHIDSHLVIEKGSQFANEYQTWGKASAEDFLHGRFGEPIVAPEHYQADGKLEWEKPIIHKQADGLEISNRNLLRERLQNAQSLIGDPKKGETVADFMARYNLKNADVSGSIYNHLKNEAMISGGGSVKAEAWANIDKMPSELKKSIFENFAANKGVAFGYVKMFFGDRSGVKDGIKSFFNYQGEVNPEDIKIKPDGSILYENAFGKKGYDLQISREKIGVDGPGWNNLAKNRMSLDNVSAAKRFILSGKTIEDNINDYEKMEKGLKTEKPVVDNQVPDSSSNLVKKQETDSINSGGTGPDSKSDRGRKNDLNVGHKSEGKIIDISTEHVSPEKTPGKAIDLSSTENKASVEKIKNIETQIPKTDMKHFNELVLKHKDISDNDIEKVVKAAPEGKERSLVAKAIAKVMEMRNLEDEKNF